MTDRCEKPGSYLDLLRVLTPGLQGVPNDKDLESKTKVYTDEEGKRVAWRTVYTNGRLQLVEATFDAGTEFACHVDERLARQFHEHPAGLPDCLLNHHYIPVSGRCNIRIHDVTDPARVIEEVPLTLGYAVESGVPHSLVAEIESVIFVALVPAGR